MTLTKITLASRPSGTPTPENFALETSPLPEPGPNEILIRTIYLSLDPYMRGRMDDAKSYADPVPLGGTMEGQSVGEVIASNNSKFAVGDIVLASTGWASHGVSDGTGVMKIDPSIAPISTALGVLGMPGLTAWVGLNDIAQAQSGETIIVSAATGAVGSLVSQLAKLKGMRVIGVAGGADKCAFAVENLGCDACVDHRAAENSDALRKEIAKHAPDGVDIYWENVGGKTVEAVLPLMNTGGRIPVCGMIAWYSGKGISDALPMPAAWRAILVKRLRVQGFIIFDHYHRLNDFHAEVGPLVASGKVHFRESVTQGLENAPAAFLSLLEGGNFGKQLVQVGPDS